jgi:hypothetical protein
MGADHDGVPSGLIDLLPSPRLRSTTRLLPLTARCRTKFRPRLYKMGLPCSLSAEEAVTSIFCGTPLLTAIQKVSNALRFFFLLFIFNFSSLWRPPHGLSSFFFRWCEADETSHLGPSSTSPITGLRVSEFLTDCGFNTDSLVVCHIEIWYLSCMCIAISGLDCVVEQARRLLEDFVRSLFPSSNPS